MKKDEILDILKSLKSLAENEYKAELVGLFGSYARDEATKQSDIDILVKFSDKASYFDLVDLADYLEERFDRKVDVVSERAVREELKHYIYNDLIRI